jgi:Zn finger protein HypA/HybF involved in hydrogenase expression
MDLEIELECRKCGVGFTKAFEEVQIGKTLRCPSCSACSLKLAGDDGASFKTDDGQRFIL